MPGRHPGATQNLLGRQELVPVFADEPLDPGGIEVVRAMPFDNVVSATGLDGEDFVSYKAKADDTWASGSGEMAAVGIAHVVVEVRHGVRLRENGVAECASGVAAFRRFLDAESQLGVGPGIGGSGCRAGQLIMPRLEEVRLLGIRSASAATKFLARGWCEAIRGIRTGVERRSRRSPPTRRRPTGNPSATVRDPRTIRARAESGGRARRTTPD